MWPVAIRLEEVDMGSRDRLPALIENNSFQLRFWSELEIWPFVVIR